MLFEYALEPDFLINYERCRYFLEKFGIPRGRLLAEFPTAWLKMVRERFSRELEAGRCSELDLTRVEVMLGEVKSCLVSRTSDYVTAASWLSNAENEHFRIPFQAIIATENPRRRDFVVKGAELDEAQARWKVANSSVVERNPKALAAAVFPLLKVSETLVFIDPHFGPENGRYRKVFLELMKASVAGRVRDPNRVIYFTGTAAENGFLSQTCNDELPKITPNGLKVEVVKLAQRYAGEKLHNRYVLTERGGISLGTGLDTGEPGQTDDANLLSFDQYLHRWNDYMGVTPSFDTIFKIGVIGTARR
jgi:hypothetical protein